MTLDELNALDEKVDKALSRQFVGEVTFNDEERTLLAKSCLPLFDSPNYVPSKKQCKYAFVLFTSLTQALGMENDTNIWTDLIFSSFCKYAHIYNDGSIQNRFYRVMGDEGKVFDTIKNEGNIVFENPDDAYIKRYYATFLCNALAPKSSFEKFFDYCFRTSCRFDLSDIEDLDEFSEALANSFNAHYDASGSEESAKKITEAGNFSSSIKQLSLQYHKEFYRFFSRVLQGINQLLNPENNQELPSDNYLNVLLNNWFNGQKDTFASEYRNRSANKVRFKPDIYYSINENGKVFLNISDFCIDKPSDSFFSNGYLEYIVKIGNESIKKGEIYVNYNEPFYQSEYVKIELDRDVFNNNDEYNLKALQNLSIVISDGVFELFNTEFNLRSLKRDFILFPPIKRGESRREITGSYGCGNYSLLCPDFSNVFISYPSSMRPIADYLYSFEAFDGDSLETLDSHIFFFNKIKYEKPEFLEINFPTTYKEADREFKILNSGYLRLRLGKYDRLEDYGYVIENLTNIDNDPSMIRDELLELSNCEYYETDDSKIVEISYDKANIPSAIKLAKIQSPNYCIAEQEFISIPDLEVEYPSNISFEESIDFDIKLNGKSVSVRDDGTIPYLNGVLYFGDLPLFECKIGNMGWMTYPNLPLDIYYNEISNSAAISFRPSSINFIVILNGKPLPDNKKFGEELYNLANQSQTKVVDVQISYFSNGKNEQKYLFSVYLKPAFKDIPFRQELLPDGSHQLWWDPNKDNFIGPKNKDTHFRVTIHHNGVEETLNNYPLTFDRNYLGSQTKYFQAGNYRMKVYIDNPFKDLYSNRDCIFDRELILFKGPSGQLEAVPPSNKVIIELEAYETEDKTDEYFADADVLFSYCEYEGPRTFKSLKLKRTYAILNSHLIENMKYKVYVGDLWATDGENGEMLYPNVVWYRGKKSDRVLIAYGCYDKVQKKLIESANGDPYFYVNLSTKTLSVNKANNKDFYKIESVFDQHSGYSYNDNYYLER